MDLGLRSNPNLHRAYRGPFRVRIEARKGVGGAGKTSGKRIERIEIYVGDRNLERKVVEERAHTKPNRFSILWPDRMPAPEQG